MIHYIEGNLFDSPAQAIVNTVNTVGVMGKGIALQFKNRFPNNFKAYKNACKNKTLDIGKLLVFEEGDLLSDKKIIINFPTKTHWRKPSEYTYIEQGLIALQQVIKEYNIKSIALPPLGAGNGGLDWEKVKKYLEKHLEELDIDIYIYTPNSLVKEVLRQERVKLTPARAMLLSVLYDLVKNGEFVSEFAAEKVSYFLQRFGAQDQFKLDYTANYYGPYSGKVRHVLYHLNGSYLMGYNSKDKKPFEEISLLMDTEPDVDAYLNQPSLNAYKAIAEDTKIFLRGSYSYFSMELISTIDYVMLKKRVKDFNSIKTYLSEWNDRKRTLFSNDRFIQISIDKLNRYLNF